MKTIATIRRLLASFAAVAMLAAPASALVIPDTPLRATQSVPPNVMFLLDDSGSMMWDVMPDELVMRGFHGFLFPLPHNTYGSGLYYTQSNLSGVWTSPSAGIYLAMPNFDDNNIYSVILRSSNNNSLFYNPELDYSPWKDQDGRPAGVKTGWLTADPADAYWHPGRTSQGRINLTVLQASPTAHWFRSTASDYRSATPTVGTGSINYYPMTFYRYDSGDANLISSYTRYQIRGNSAYKKKLPAGSEQAVSSFTWPNGKVRSVEQEKINFANWFQFYRSRVIAAQGSTSQAFADLGTEYRVGFATINKRGSTSDELAVPTSGNFSGSNRTAFFQKLLAIPINPQGTPLRGALQWAGSNYQSNYWKDSISCRRAFTILTTDGYWNGDGNLSVGNQDGNMGRPYADSFSNTLADVAMYYWKTDLSGLKNDIAKTENDPATYQHMTSFGLSIGLRGTLDPKQDLPALISGSKNWPDPTTANPHKIDDLWHMAVNSRGTFVAAQNPEEFRKGLVSALSEITAMSGALAAGGVSSRQYASGALYFQMGFDSGNWNGQLQAYELQLSGTSVLVKSTPKWAAENELTSAKVSAGTRKVIIGNGSSGGSPLPFRYNDLNNAGLASSNGLTSALVDYLRGSAANEGVSSGQFRKRTGLLGDIIGSSPLYVGKPVKATDGNARKPVVYVGANDGMLHAFNADDGKELFAFIPQVALPKLKNLAALNYASNHLYYVDGQLSQAEVGSGSSGSNWRTLLAGGTGRGGKEWFLLDVTTPDATDESTAQRNKLLRWEFTASNDSHLGVTVAQPHIVKLNDGSTMVLAPNGYNSATGSAALFMLPTSKVSSWSTGSYFRLVADNSGDNGLSEIMPYDLDKNGTVDLVYAGDLKGNLWKFDLSSSNPDDWEEPEAITRLFRALGPDGKAQPIVSAPTVAPNLERVETTPTASRPGVMVYVGTGRYLADCDKAGGVCQNEAEVNSVYGLWDYGGEVCSRKELLRQTLSDYSIGSDDGYRTISNNALVYPPKDILASACMQNGSPRTAMLNAKSESYPFPDFSQSEAVRAADSTYWLGWYFDLTKTDERVVSYLDYYKKRVEILTYIPAATSSDPCVLGEDAGYILRVNAQNGGTFTSPRFDERALNDAVKNGTSGARSVVGRKNKGSLGRVVVRYGSRLSTLLSLTGGGIDKAPDEKVGRTVQRVTWREIIQD